MNDSLRQDIKRFFSVFKNNVEYDLHRLLPATVEAIKFQVEFEEELDAFHTSVINRLSKDSII